MKRVSNGGKTKDLATIAMMAALVFVVTFFVQIPIPVSGGAYLNFGDVVIFICAYLLGAKRTAVAGAVGSVLADLALGAAIYALPTLLIKGCMGLLAGTICKKKKFGYYVLACVCAGAVMVVGYSIFELLFFDVSYAAASLPFNLIQWGGSVAAACALYPVAGPVGKMLRLNYQ